MKKLSNKGAVQPGGSSAVPNSGYKVGRAIRAREVRLIDQTGKNLGVMTTDRAIILAEEAGLDLVQLSEGGDDNCPIVKVMDLGRFLYEKKKQDAVAKKNQKVIEVKEIKLRPAIGAHDYQIKLNQAIDFLKDGKHVKITIQFRGREIAFSEVKGTEMFGQITDLLTAGVENEGKLEYGKESRGTNLWSRVYSVKTK